MTAIRSDLRKAQAHINRAMFLLEQLRMAREARKV